MTKVDSSIVLKDILDTERRVLKRKCRFLKETVYITDSVLDQLVTREILTNQEANRIKDVFITDRCMALSDVLFSKDRPFLDALISSLHSVDESVAKEMRAELQLELGILECTDREREEAAALVHRHFGSSRRMPEMEKRQIARLIAMKAQVVRESTKRELARLVDDLEKYRTITQHTETKLFDINNRLKRFIRVNELDAPNPFCDMRSTTEALMRPRTPVTDVLTDLEDKITFLMSRLMRIAAEKQTLIRYGRNPAKTVVNGPVLPSVRISERHLTAEFGVMPSGSDVISHEVLKARCMCLENELEAKERHLDDARTELKIKQKQVVFLRGLLQAVGLNVPIDLDMDYDVIGSNRGQMRVKSKLTKTVGRWSQHSARKTFTLLPSVNGLKTDNNDLPRTNKTSQHPPRIAGKRRENKRTNPNKKN
ncbi:hypothetical protein LSH36_53g01006 [Paralvinella palmiformis]|uniref:CARD domain-containing protein n=1 Tax=Paralvinella palmiformis TaxID=53620 RepID=A0AAD9K621_9ANNE|nr:hypothetical protein LSH36_53g01006 [Paralvinella palmiformis]